MFAKITRVAGFEGTSGFYIKAVSLFLGCGEGFEKGEGIKWIR